MEKKASGELNDNSSGTVSVVMGIFSIIFAILSPLIGIVFGVIAFFFAYDQSKKQVKGWGKIGKILSIIGVVLSVIIWILTITIFAPYIEQYMAQYSG